MKIIILAAGKGERLLPLTRNTPKSLIDLGNGTTLLEAQLRSIRAAGLANVVIVGGYRVEQIEAKLAMYRAEQDLHVEVIYNPFYDVSNNLVSLWFGRPAMLDGDGFVIVNGDDVFKPAVLQSLLEVPPERSICVTVSRKPAYDEDDMKVAVQDGRVRRISKQLPAAEAHAESIGMIRVVGKATRLLVDELDAMVRDQRNRSVFWLEAFNRLADKGWPVDLHEVPSADWAEIDFHPQVAALRERLADSISWLHDAE